MRLLALILWLFERGDDVSIDPAAIPDAAAYPPRTIEDVELELHMANALIVERRARQGDKAKFLERIDGRPGILVQEVNWLLDEWMEMRALAE